MTQTMREELIDSAAAAFIIAGAILGGYLGGHLYAPLFAQIGGIGAGLLAIIAADMIDHVRSRQRAARREGQWRQDGRVVAGEEEVSQEPAADEVVIGRERARLLAQAVAELPPKMGQAFRLHKLEGRSQADTAQAMGVSVKMVEQHIAAAIKHLSQRLRS